MNIDFDRLKYSLTGEYEEVMLEKQLKEKDKEIERLNNIINELEKTLNNYDLDYMDLVGEHLLADILEDLKDKIKELKGSDKE